MDKLAPHIFGILHRLERHLAEIARFKQEPALPPQTREYVRIHYPQIRRTLAYLRRQAILLQLAGAKSDVGAEQRQIQIFYGVLELVRPEVLAALVLCRSVESGANQAPATRLLRAAH